MSEYKVASVIGLSTLRANEPAANASAAKDNKRSQYLSKYMSADDDAAEGKKKKRKKKRKASQMSSVNVVDEDVGWPVEAERPLGFDDQAGDAVQDDDDEGPVVENAAEVQHQLKLMQSEQQFQAQWEGEVSPGAEQRAPARARHDSDDDSPPRRKARHDSDDDSPARRVNVSGTGTASRPPQSSSHAARARHHSDDESSPRRGAPAAGQSSQPGSRPTARHDSDDESPVRRRPGPSGASRAAPQQRQRHDPDDESPPRRASGPTAAAEPQAGRARAQRHDSDDESPPRRSGTAEQPARGGKGVERDTGVDRGSSRDAAPTRAPLAGLVAPQEMAAQIREDRERRKQIDAVASGRDAEAAFRVGGRVVSKEEFQEAQNARQPKKQPKFIEEDVTWKGGLVQRRAAENQQNAQQEEGRKKFQRGFDATADTQLQQELRMDDPMAQYFASKKMDALSAADAAAPSAVYDAELGGSSGFSVPQQVPEHSWIRRGVQDLPNRYKIKPGRHWDGVHRSNGFEKKFVFQFQHKKAERARDEYVLAEDM